MEFSSELLGGGGGGDGEGERESKIMWHSEVSHPSLFQ